MNRPLFTGLIYSLIFLFCLTAAASEEGRTPVGVRYISNIDGLTNNAVNCILEDSEYTVWIGTWDGLNAYNGRDIHTFRYSKNNPGTIGNNIIRQLIEQGPWLWVATDNGINRIDRQTYAVTRYYLPTGNRIPTREKSFVLGKTAAGELFCLVRGNGYFRYDPDSDAFIPVPVSFAAEISDYQPDEAGNVLCLFTDGTVKRLAADKLRNGAGTPDLVSVDLPFRAERLFQAGNRFVLVAGNAVALLDTAFSLVKNIRLPVRKTVSQAVLNGNRLLMGFTEGGVMRYDLKTDTHAYLGELPGGVSVLTLYSGSRQILWIGTDGQGLVQIYPYRSLFTTVYASHPVRCFAEDLAGRILVGSKGGGIKRLDRTGRRLEEYLSEQNGLASNSVYALTRNRAGDIFIGTEGAGIQWIPAEGDQPQQLRIPEKYPAFRAVYGLLFTGNDSVLWAGTSGYGLIRIGLARENGAYRVTGFRQYTSADRNSAQNNDVVYAVASLPGEPYVWFGTRGGGLNRIDAANNRLQPLEEIYSNMQLTNNDVLCLSRDSDELWIGTSYGLNEWRWQGNVARMIPYADGRLNNKTVHGILKDELGSVWVSTSQGLARLTPGNEKTEHYTRNDGLQDNEFSDGAFFKDSSGTLYFGGVKGLNYFRPQPAGRHSFDPPLDLCALKIYDTSYPLADRIRNGVLKLEYGERFVTLTFIARDLIRNENCEYAYRLANYSDEWIPSGNNPNIVLAQLPPGTYRLEVKCTDSNRIWSDHVYRLTLRVGYPWWFSWPAWVLYIAACMSIAWITRSVIRNRIRLNRQVFIARMEKQHEQQVYESKLNFFTDVAHEFFTPLTLIYTPAHYLLEQAPSGDKTRGYLEIIRDNAERMQRLVGELMEFRKAGSGAADLHPDDIDLRALVEYTSAGYIPMLKENRIDFSLRIHDTSVLCSDRNALEKIFFNLLSNAFKYTPGSGYIEMEVWQHPAPVRTMELRIRNSGKGLTDAQMARIFDKYIIFDTPRPDRSVSNGIGLHLTKSLVAALGGTIRISSEPGKYVEFAVTIPPLPASTATEARNYPDTGELPAEGKAAVPTSQADRSNGEKKVPKETKEQSDTVILIVEDEKKIRDLLRSILPEYKIQEAADGAKALGQIGRNHPDLIICDMIMPNMDGLSLIDQLKSDPRTGYIPVIGLSAKTSIEDRIEAFNHGADAYIAKPFHPRHVRSTVENLLSRQALLKDYFNSSLSSFKVKDGLSLHTEDEELIRKVSAFVTEHIDDETLSPVSVADFIGVSKATLYRRFHEITGKTPSKFIRTLRLEHAARLLRTTKLTVSEIMYQSGFSNKSYFYREFQKQYQVSPKDYRNK